jgi:hypothetical protein
VWELRAAAGAQFKSTDLQQESIHEDSSYQNQGVPELQEEVQGQYCQGTDDLARTPRKQNLCDRREDYTPVLLCPIAEASEVASLSSLSFLHLHLFFPSHM